MYIYIYISSKPSKIHKMFIFHIHCFQKYENSRLRLVFLINIVYITIFYFLRIIDYGIE